MEDTDEGGILIVDDNLENLRVLGDMLKKANYKVRIARNGKQALASIQASEPDLLLLDVHMPEMDGFELCQILKSDDSKFKNLPVIFLSALTDTFNKLLAFKAGAIDYMTKPFAVEEVLVRIKTHLKLRSYQHTIENLKKELQRKNEEIKELSDKKTSRGMK